MCSNKPRTNEKFCSVSAPTNIKKLTKLRSYQVSSQARYVCGPGGWQNRYTHADKKTVCEIGILLNGEWVWKADGAGESDIESEKGALSDAFKRAAVRWGIGRYLYHLQSPWVALEPMGRSQKIKDSEYAKLDALLVRDAATTTPARAVANPAKGPLPRPTLPERAKAFEDALKASASDPIKLERTFKLGAGVCAELDAKDPERLVEITTLYERLQETPAEVFA